jgi:hypothetical protein
MTEAQRGFLAALWDDDGIEPGVRADVLARDLYHCLRCGVPVIGRRPGVAVRNEDAPLVAENLVTACDPCRRSITRREDPEDRENGLWLRPGQDPAATPVRRRGSDKAEWLTEDGLPPQGVSAA